MQDRVPLYPGRVKLITVSGQENTYDMVRADEPTQEGTPLNKATFLKDATAALYGFPNTAVPDDAFKELGVFKRDVANYYVWDKEKITTVISNGSLISTSATVILWNNPGTIAQYSSSAIIQNNEIVLEDPITVSFAQLKALGNNIRGKYFINTNDTSAGVKVNALVYIPNDATIGGGENVVTTNKYYYPSIVENVEHIAYILTQNSVAPVEEGYRYVNMGQLGDKARIATGSYTGTGTYGSSNPNSLTFEFEPKFIWLYGQMYNERWGHLNYNLGYCTVVATDTLTTQFVGNRGFYQVGDYNTMYAKKSADGKNVQWYVTQNAEGQYNAIGYTYYYLAIV